MIDLGSLSGGVGAGWIGDLSKRLRLIRERRRNELNTLYDVFTGDLLELARRYIEPTLQSVNPLEHRDSPPPPSEDIVSLRNWISDFIGWRFSEHDGHQVLLLLADAGMGKTSALIVLKLMELTAFWPPDYRFQLFKLGPDSVREISNVEHKSRCILLLDALDEDPTAFGRIYERLEELLQAAKGFRRIVITCRTQFLPPAEPTPFGDRRYISFAGFLCHVRYISPFTRAQSDQYLRGVFLRGRSRFLRGRAKLGLARSLVSSIGSLSMRPLILSYIEDLLDLPLGLRKEPFLLYGGLVDRWLLRETRKLRSKYGPSAPSTADLRGYCELLASRLHLHRLRSASIDLLSEVLTAKGAVVLETLDFGGRSLLNKDSEGSFRFAHRTIEEFLVASHVIRQGVDSPSLESLVGPRIPASDQILAFFFSALRSFGSGLEAGIPGLGRRIFASQADRIEWIAQLSVQFIIDRRSLPDRGGGVSPALALSILNCHFDLQLFGRSLDGLDLSHGFLKRANLANYNLRHARLEYANLQDANLAGADLSFASLRSAKLRGAKTEGTRFDSAILDGADFGDGGFRR